MQNVWKFFIVLMFTVTVKAGGVEPVLMNLDGSAIEDKAQFHLVHGIVRDWQYDLLYKEGDKPADAGAVLNEALAAHGVKAMMVPTTLWQMIFCEVNVLSPEFERMKNYCHHMGPPATDTTEIVEGESLARYLFNYGASRFYDAATEEEAYGIIHRDTKHPRMSRLKQMVDNHILAKYREADNPDAWESMVRRFVETYTAHLTTCPSGRHDEPVYAEDPTLALPGFVGVGGRRFPMLAERVDRITKILQTELDTLKTKTLLLMRATGVITFAGDEVSYGLQDSPMRLKRSPIGTKISSMSLETDSINSLSFANSYLGGIPSTDSSANVHYFWSTTHAVISTLELPAGLPSGIRNVFWLPPFFGPLEMIRAGEYHPRLKILPGFASGASGIQCSSCDKIGFAEKSLFHTPYDLGELISSYHTLASKHLSTITPPCSGGKDPYDVDFYRVQNAKFSTAAREIVKEGIPMKFSHGIDMASFSPKEGVASAGAGGAASVAVPA